MSTVNNKHGELQITFSTLESKQLVPYHHFSVFYFHLQSQVAVKKKQIQTVLPHLLKQEITRLNNKCRNLDILRLEPKIKKLPPCKKKMYHCLWYHPVPPLFSFFFNFSFLLICKKIPYCFFSMGRVSIKTYITRKSIGKIDNQKSSGIELELVAIPQPDYYTPFFFPRSM